MARIPPHKPLLDRDFIPGDDGEEMVNVDSMGNLGCGGKYYRRGCFCEDCMERGDREYEEYRDRKMMEED